MSDWEERAYKLLRYISRTDRPVTVMDQKELALTLAYIRDESRRLVKEYEKGAV